MRRRSVGLLGVAAILLVVGGFALMGLSRLVLPIRTARLLAAPLLGAGFLAAVATFVLAALEWVGIVQFDD